MPKQSPIKKEIFDNRDNRAAAYCGERDSLPGNIIDKCGEDVAPLHFGNEAALFMWDYQMGANNNVFRIL